MSEKSKMKQIGGLWKHKDKDGNTFLSGNIDLTELSHGAESADILIFKNKYRKEGTKQPDFRIVVPADASTEELKDDNNNPSSEWA